MATRADVTRRTILASSVLSAMGSAAHAAASGKTVVLPFENGERPLVAYPQKRPLLRLTTRPPQLETPMRVFDECLLTPNDAFFVRYHLAGLPFDNLDAATFRLRVSGHVERPLSLSLADLKRLPHVELVAVNQCSGNGRGFFEPRVAGGQAGNGLMGNARWTGVSLRRVLDAAGVRAGAMQVQFAGLDKPIDPATPTFAKALNLDHATDGEVMLAWDMNGAPLPILNGFPLRLVVPGHYGTYWIKHLSDITVLDHTLDNFWMKTAYRIPDNDCACVQPGEAPPKTHPIGRYNVRSFITNASSGDRLPAGRPHLLRGIAFDGGSGIKDVDLSLDGGATWQAAKLEPEVSVYSFRQWSTSVTLEPGPHEIQVRATNRKGETQPATARWNASGYMRNVIEAIKVVAQ